MLLNQELRWDCWLHYFRSPLGALFMCPPNVTLASHIIEEEAAFPLLRHGLRSPEYHFCCVVLVKASEVQLRFRRSHKVHLSRSWWWPVLEMMYHTNQFDPSIDWSQGAPSRLKVWPAETSLKYFDYESISGEIMACGGNEFIGLKIFFKLCG